MITRWIVVADASRARVLSTADDVPGLLVVHQLNNPSSRIPSREIVSDEPGRLEKGGHGVLSAMDPPTDPHEYQAQRFAGKLAHLLDKAADRRAYARLTLVAPAHFLGLLKSSISSQVQKRLTESLSKDLTPLRLAELSRRLRKNQPGPVRRRNRRVGARNRRQGAFRRRESATDPSQ